MIIVIGAGVAGLSCALAAVQSGADVELITRGELAGAEHAGAETSGSALALAGGSTALAQGGIAAAIASTDSPAAHLSDTLRAGAGLTDERAARVLTAEGAEAVRHLIAAGFDVDRDRRGQPSLGLEAAHSAPRIVHVGGDRTGAALHAWLTRQVRAVVAGGNVGRGGDAGRGEAARGGAARRAVDRGTLTITEDARVTDLVVRDGRVAGVKLIRPDARSGFDAMVPETRSADAVVIASGGYAALYPRSSNHPETKGAGLVLAARAGALLADLEFVQFHPTVLAPDGDLGCRDLVSEAVRGAGAVLRDGSGERFMVGRHPAAELAPRDVVSREIHRVLRERGEATVWLDATGIEAGGVGPGDVGAGGRGTLARMFPGIDAAVRRAGLDWARDPIPVAPAAHYTMGGIATDLLGRSSLPGLFAAGEAAATGVNGANRLASNSLLEGLVFGRRAGEEAARFAAGEPRCGGADRGLDRSCEWWDASGEFGDVLDVTGACGAAQPAGEPLSPSAADPGGSADPAVPAAIAAGLGIERDAAGIAWAAEVCARSATPDAQLGTLIAAAAEAREESRGAHQRAEFPETDPAQAWRRAVRMRAAGAGMGMGMGASATRSATVPADAPAARSYQLTN